MGVKIKRCEQCGKITRIGRSKKRCKGCRRKCPVPPWTPTVPPGSPSKRTVVAAGGATYALRDLVLKQLGYANYATYQASALWRTIRVRIYARDGGQCVLCRARAAAIHHLDYRRATLRGRNDRALVSLCDTCHGQVEFDSNGNKRTLAGVMVAYLELRTKLLTTSSRPAVPLPGRSAVAGGVETPPA